MCVMKYFCLIMTIRRLLTLAALLLVVASIATYASSSQRYRGGREHPTPPTEQNIGSVTLSALSFTPGSPSGTVVGAVDVVMVPGTPAFSGQLSLSGTDAASFQLSSPILPANLETNGTLCGSPPCSYNINIVATQFGITNSPKTQPFFISSTADSLSIAKPVFNNPVGASALPATWFWTLGLPMKKGSLTSSEIFTATLGGSSVRVCAEQIKQEIDGSAAWMKLIVDGSGVAISPGSSATLELTPTTGSWSTTTTRTDADWIALDDRVTLSNLTTTGTAATDMASGNNWLAKFDGGATNKIEVLGTSPCGRNVWVTASFVDQGTSVTHAYLQVHMEYLVAQKSDGTLGPIASRGPFLANTQVMKNTAAGINNPSQFNYDVAFTRGGNTVRSEGGVPHVGLSFANLPRSDGQLDWTANDPGIWVGWDYAKLRPTLKIPSFIDGINYVGADGYNKVSEAVTSINATSGVLTLPKTSNLWFNSDLVHRPNAVEFVGTTLPSGVVANRTYWMTYRTSTTVTLYDTIGNALAAAAVGTCPSSTGQVCPGSSFTSIALRLNSAPTSAGQYCQFQGNGGNRPDISLLSEWGSAYIISNSSNDPQGFQRKGRVMADNFGASPTWVMNHALAPDGFQHVPCIIGGGLCPAGLVGAGQTATTFQTTYWAATNVGGGNACSVNIGAGNCATTVAGTQAWNNWKIQRSHWPGAVYGPWLLTGDEYLRRLLVINAAQAIGHENSFFGMDFAAGPNGTQACSSGTGKCYGVMGAFQNLTNIRRGAWEIRDLGIGAFAALQGSPEETYFRTILRETTQASAWYINYNGANYAAVGIHSVPDFRPTITSSLNTTPSAFQGNHFMGSYDSVSKSFADMLQGDFVTGTVGTSPVLNYGLHEMALHSARYTVGLYNTLCGFYATAVSMSNILADPGGGQSSPATFAGFDGYGITTAGGDGIFTINTDSSVTQTTGYCARFCVAVGDKLRFTRLGSESVGLLNAAVSPYADNVFYTIASIDGPAKKFTFEEVPVSPGSSAGQTNVGGFFTMTASGAPANCPATGTAQGFLSNGDAYVAGDTGVLGLSAIIGAPGAATAWPKAFDRLTNPLPNWWNGIVQNAFQPVP